MDFYLWASARCALKEYCRTEIAAKLKTKGASPDEITDLLNRLEAEGFINEARYAAAFASDKFRFDHWGRIKISYSLRLKGISESNVESALQNIDPEAYTEALKSFISTKLKSIKAKSDYEAGQKIARAAIARGFEPALVFEAVRTDD